jgi:hypothetical protein
MSELIATGAAEQMLYVLEGQGLPVRKSLHIDIPPFPVDITLVDDQELMVLAAKYMENYNFVSTQVACAAIAELEAENLYEYEHSKRMIEKTTGKTTEKSIMLKAIVAVESDISNLVNRKTYAYAYRKMLETMKEGLERYYYLVSREITRRGHGDRMKTNRFTP